MCCNSNFYGWTLKVCPLKKLKAVEQHFPVVLFIMLYKVVIPFESVDEILKCDNSNELSAFQFFPSSDILRFLPNLHIVKKEKE